MSNSTVTASINLQIQDNLNQGQTPVNRTVPQFVYPALATATYAGYYQLQPNSINFINTGTGTGFCFLFVRNATAVSIAGATFIVTYTDNTSTTAGNTVTLAPGGFMILASQFPNAGLGAFSNVTIQVLSTAQTVVIEIMYAI